MPIRILIADDHAMMRDGLRALLEKEKGFVVAAEAADGRSAVKKAGELPLDVIVMDVAMPGLNGIEATRRIVAAHPAVKVVGLSMHSHVRFIAEMLKAGASGYVLKESAFDELARAIRLVNASKKYLGRGVVDELVEDYLHHVSREEDSAYSILTPREREVLQLLAEGSTTKETASKLGVSVKTVEYHRSQIMRKVDASSVAELTKYAIREGLTSLED
jgi:DNA-binding NarL/FixJ family response regulator